MFRWIAKNPPLRLKIRLHRSKTDQFSKGINIHVYLGTTGDELCPVSALPAYLAVRRSAAGPLFWPHDGQSHTREIFTRNVHVALSTLGYNSELYAGHSFRIGAATTAAKRGVENSKIKMLGRWESSAYL